MSDALDLLTAAGRGLARTDGRQASLETILAAAVPAVGAAAAAVFATGPGGELELAATHGLAEPALSALVAAVANPGHPVPRTAADATAGINVLPTAPGGPALRTHLPLLVTRQGQDRVLGVVALAHESRIGPGTEPLLQAVADLLAVAIDREE